MGQDFVSYKPPSLVSSGVPLRVLESAISRREGGDQAFEEMGVGGGSSAPGRELPSGKVDSIMVLALGWRCRPGRFEEDRFVERSGAGGSEHLHGRTPPPESSRILPAAASGRRSGGDVGVGYGVFKGGVVLGPGSGFREGDFPKGRGRPGLGEGGVGEPVGFGEGVLGHVMEMNSRNATAGTRVSSEPGDLRFGQMEEPPP